MWVNEINLIQETYNFDEIGNQIPIEVKNSIFCDVKSVGRTEFYNAAVNGLKPTIIFVIHSYEYNGEKQVEFEGKKYKVIRTYATGPEEVELTCEKV
jgi:SPP1 family predicted phage head-tail adaptor